ncbi:MAG: PAS domain S-box protein [Desulfobulbaceae bacterium]|nr:PAS domain S-box protein [Desulfobulbaceae bacterium]
MNDRDQTKEWGSDKLVADEGQSRVGPESFQQAFEGHGAVMYVVDLTSFLIVDANKAALKFYGYDRATMLTKRIPDLNVTPELEIRAEIERAVVEGRSYYIFKHQLASGELRDVEIHANPISIRGKDYSFSIVHDITDRKKMETEREILLNEIQQALENVKTLKGLLPICAKCKKIRDDKGYWNNLESYIENHSDASFSHGICSECSDTLYGSEDWYIKMKDKKGTK